MPYWATKAYLVGLGVFAQVQSEFNDPDDENSNEPSPFKFTGKGDSDAFKLIHEHLAEGRNRGWTPTQQ